MTHNLISGREALALAANEPAKRIHRHLKTGDIVRILNLEDGLRFGQVGECPNVAWIIAEVSRPATRQTFALPVFISYFVNEMEDQEGKVYACRVLDGVDFEECETLLDQFSLIAGRTFRVEVTRFPVIETNRRTGARYQRERCVYTWERC